MYETEMICVCLRIDHLKKHLPEEKCFWLGKMIRSSVSNWKLRTSWLISKNVLIIMRSAILTWWSWPSTLPELESKDCYAESLFLLFPLCFSYKNTFDNNCEQEGEAVSQYMHEWKTTKTFRRDRSSSVETKILINHHGDSAWWSVQYTRCD